MDRRAKFGLIFVDPNDNTLIDQVNVQGILVDDTLLFNFRDKKTPIDKAEILAIDNMVIPGVSTAVVKWPGNALGYIGLAPYTREDEYSEYNFLLSLYHENEIEQLVFSLFMDLDPS